MAHGLHNLLVRRIHDRASRRCAAGHLRGRLIDIGCGTKPYRAMLEPIVAEHVGLDHAGSLHARDHVDLVGTAYEVPVPDASFDSALCTAVLEHLEEPEQALRECNRILAPGGRAVFSVPFIWHVHEEPRDFYRYSAYGLRYLFEKSGFEVLELEALSGFWVTFGQLLVYNVERFNRGLVRRTGVLTLLGLAVQGVVYALDRLDRNERWTWMYMVVAGKPERAEATAGRAA